MMLSVNNSPLCCRRRATPARRGYLTLFFILSLPLMLMGVALVLNWTYLSFIFNQMQEQTDLYAQTAVSELLDENLLEEAAPDQTDDLADAQAAVESYRAANAVFLQPRLALQATDLSVAGLFVTDVTLPADGGNLTAGPPYNSLRVRADRDPGGLNPVQVLMRGYYGGAEVVRIHTESIATLDSRVVGYRPTDLRPTPLAPLAILDDAWFSDRVTGNDDSFNMNGRKELVLTLKLQSGGGSNNAVLIGVDGTTLATGAIATQVLDGIFPADLLPNSEFGPFSSGSPAAYPATDTSPGGTDTADIAAAFDTVASDPQTPNRRRIFPIYTSYNSGAGEASLTGFVAADVLEVDLTAGNDADAQLIVRVEPQFYIHVTAITDPSVPENVYVHKIRLSR